jgi:hypothetical protein
MAKTGRDRPCTCGSGRRYESCCGAHRSLPGAVDGLRILHIVRRPEGDEEAKGLLDSPTGAEGEFRSFTVVDVVRGKGVWVVEVDPRSSERSGPRWVEDEVASLLLEPECVFGLTLGDEEPIRVPPFWRDCPHCRELLARRRSLSGWVN